MTIRLEKINKDNYIDCINLTVSDSQKNYVSTNEYSLVQAAYEDEEMYPLAIYDEDTMVGFILYDFESDRKAWSFLRFMIDVKYQNKGYGRKAMAIFLDYFNERHPNCKLITSASVKNHQAIALYESFGFEKKETFEYTFNDIHYKEIRMIKPAW